MYSSVREKLTMTFKKQRKERHLPKSVMKQEGIPQLLTFTTECHGVKGSPVTTLAFREILLGNDVIQDTALYRLSLPLLLVPLFQLHLLCHFIAVFFLKLVIIFARGNWW